MTDYDVMLLRHLVCLSNVNRTKRLLFISSVSLCGQQPSLKPNLTPFCVYTKMPIKDRLYVSCCSVYCHHLFRVC